MIKFSVYAFLCYATGIVGKWHLGHHRQFLPLLTCSCIGESINCYL